MNNGEHGASDPKNKEVQERKGDVAFRSTLPNPTLSR